MQYLLLIMYMSFYISFNEKQIVGGCMSSCAIYV